MHAYDIHFFSEVWLSHLGERSVRMGESLLQYLPHKCKQFSFWSRYKNIIPKYWNDIAQLIVPRDLSPMCIEYLLCDADLKSSIFYIECINLIPFLPPNILQFLEKTFFQNDWSQFISSKMPSLMTSANIRL